MKNRKILLSLLALAVVLALSAACYGLVRFGISRGAQQAAAAASNAPAPAEGGKKVLYWQDPMVPGQRFEQPGKSPFMDMPLVPVYAEPGADEGKVVISPRVQQNLGLRTAEVTRGTLVQAIAAVGNVIYNERLAAVVQARSNGYVERLLVRAPLEIVRQGQPLAELYVPEWVAAQEEYLAVKAMGSAMAGVLDGARQRMRLVGMNEEQIQQVVKSGRVQARLSVTAPVGGIVTELSAREGMTVMAGAPLFRLNGLQTIWVNAEIAENNAALVRPGMSVEARSAALPGSVFKGKVGALLPEVDSATRTLKARIELANPGLRLVPGMFVNVALTPDGGREVLLVPSEAVIQTGQRSVVMTAQADGRFLPVEVETGAESKGQTEIRQGLTAGQKVVVSGQFLIDSEASLKGSALRMSDAGAAPAGPSYHAEGKVEQIDPDGIMISHGPVAALKWGAMTMGFQPPAGGMPKNVTVGAMVTFEFHPLKDGVYAISSIAQKANPAGAAQ